MGQDAARGGQVFAEQWRGPSRFPRGAAGTAIRDLQPERGKPQREGELPAVPETRETDPLEVRQLSGGRQGPDRGQGTFLRVQDADGKLLLRSSRGPHRPRRRPHDPRRGAPWPVPREGGRATARGCRRRRSARSSPKAPSFRAACTSEAPMLTLPSPIRAASGRRRAGTRRSKAVRACLRTAAAAGVSRQLKGPVRSSVPQRARMPGSHLGPVRSRFNPARRKNRLRLAGRADDGEKCHPRRGSSLRSETRRTSGFFRPAVFFQEA